MCVSYIYLPALAGQAPGVTTRIASSFWDWGDRWNTTKGLAAILHTPSRDSTAAWAKDTSRLERKPNIVMIVLDDVGYSQVGTYGADIDTPALDSLAETGLRYANFHVTPLCSPTRTCLLTGRNHHSLGMGRVAEMDNGFPNTRGFMARDAANLAEILRPQGYQTLAAGKWHLASIDATSPAGPYDHWPLQRGFDRFYGFLAGETNQWNPELVLGNERVEPPQKNSVVHRRVSLIRRYRRSCLPVAAAACVSRPG